MGLRDRQIAWLPAVAALCIGLMAACSAGDRLRHAWMQLQNGIAALEAGDYGRAMEECRAASRVLTTNHSAVSCWFIASVEVRDWDSAREAARVENGWRPVDWLKGVRIELERRASGQPVEVSSISGPYIAWACLERGCHMPWASEGRGVENVGSDMEALLLIEQGQAAEAAELMGSEAELDELRLSIAVSALLGSGSMDEAARGLDVLSAKVSNPGWFGRRLFAFLGQPGPDEICGNLAAELARGELESAPRAAVRPDSGPVAPGGEAPSLDSGLVSLICDGRGSKENAELLAGLSNMNPGWASLGLAAGLAMLTAGDEAGAVALLERASETAQDRVNAAGVYLVLAHLLSGNRESARELLARISGGLTIEWRQFLVSSVEE